MTNNECYAWAGTILNVDLSSMKVSRETLSREFATKYIGGSGFGARILYDEVGPEVDPLGPENIAIIGQGPLTGTTAPSGGRYVLISKSPHTGIYGRSNGGGSFGPEMKYAGYDLIVIRGRAEKPVYLWIDDDHVELKDATHLWGKDTWTTHRMIREELGDPDIKTLKIGPAGENMCYSSCVVGDLSRAAGRNSFGAVWGSKNLKAVAARGSKGVKVAKSKEFIELCKFLRNRIERDPVHSLHTEYGTTGWLEGGVPSTIVDEEAPPLFHTKFDTMFDKNLSCFGCANHCSHFYSVKSGKYKGTAGEGLEHGSGRTFAKAVGVNDPAFVCKINTVCNQLGLHTKAPESALSWAMKLYQEGIITKEDTDGLELTWGNEEAVLEMLRKICYKEGFGEVLDAYPIRAVEKLGRGSDKYMSHVKGTGSVYAMDISLNFLLASSVAPRGADHLTGAHSSTRPGFCPIEMSNEHLEKLGKDLYDDPTLILNRPLRSTIPRPPISSVI